MGTRSLTFVHDDDDKGTVLACIYRQFDGYPEGLGAEHAEFLKNITLINGIGAGQSVPGKFANGMGCLAAQLIAHMKGQSVGSVYLYPVTTKDAGQEFVYHVRRIKDQLELEVIANTYGKVTGKTVFKGTPAKVAAAIAKSKE